MPRQKDLKRHVRARMQKTGESYAAARARVLERGKPARAELPDDHEKVAGMSAAAVQKKTGRTWAEWAAVLDRAGAREMTHTAIAAHLHEQQGVPGWWAQMVAVGYERLRGLRAVNQRRDGQYEAGKSRTFPVAVARLYAAFAQPRLRARWLELEGLRITARQKDRSLRFVAADGSRFHAWFLPKGPGKSSVAVQQEKLRDAQEVARAKEAWGRRFDALALLWKE